MNRRYGGGTRLKTFLIILLLTTATISCTPFSKEIMRQVDERITLDEVRKSPEAFKGKMVLWGGMIIETENRTDETRILVLQTELDAEKSPLRLDRSGGRFMVKSPDFLDPVVYAKGRRISVAGQIAGTEELPLGEIRYTYPVVLPSQVILWEKVVPMPYDYEPWYWNRYPFGSRHSPFW